MNRRQSLIAAAALAAAAGSRAQRAAPREGVEYTVLRKPQPAFGAAAAGKIEVLEFFSYACPHCDDFDPVLARWLKQLPPDVVFRRVPVPFLANYANLQRTYFALEMTGQLDKVHSKIFDAVHREHLPFAQPADMAAVVTKAGGDAEKFSAAMTAFSMPPMLSRAKAAMTDYEIDGVPTLAVGGRYLTSPALARGLAQALGTADFLIEKVRKA